MRKSQRKSPVSGWANGPSARSMLISRRVAGRMITRERQQQEQRSQVAEQHVLEHVRREEVVLAEAVERGHERGQERQHRAGERNRLHRAGAAAAGLAARAPKAHDVDRDEHCYRREHQRVGEPVNSGSAHLSLDCRSARTRVTRSAGGSSGHALARLLSLVAPPLCWGCGGPPAREPLC